MSNAERPILFFDGVCNLCNRSVQFLIRHDKKEIFLFAPLQSEAGQHAIQSIQGRQSPDSIILLYKGLYSVKSEALLKIASLLGGWWLLLTIGYLIPRFLRDKIYDWVARNRYRWFGKQLVCRLPDERLKKRFL